jgi:hypothetical protein
MQTGRVMLIYIIYLKFRFFLLLIHHFNYLEILFFGGEENLVIL